MDIVTGITLLMILMRKILIRPRGTALMVVLDLATPGCTFTTMLTFEAISRLKDSMVHPLESPLFLNTRLGIILATLPTILLAQAPTLLGARVLITRHMWTITLHRNMTVITPQIPEHGLVGLISFATNWNSTTRTLEMKLVLLARLLLALMEMLLKTVTYDGL